jgi:S1-C subfamily serine protease
MNLNLHVKRLKSIANTVMMPVLLLPFFLSTELFSREIATAELPEQTVNTPSSVSSVTKSKLDDLVWETLGIRYIPMPKEEYRQKFANYLADRPHGGVVVKEVREGSLIAKTKILPDDVIVGIHEWVTTSQNDLWYIAKHWQTIKTSKETIEIELFRNGQLYFTEISLQKETPLLQETATAVLPEQIVDTPSSVSSVTNSKLDDLVWETLGIRYTPMPKEEYKQQFAQYLTDRPHGGVVVKEVREGSLIAKTKILPDDVIVGIHEWVTTSQNDVRYIAQNWKNIKSKRTVEIELFRDGQLFFTEIPVK